jgi:hypothetical protein
VTLGTGDPRSTNCRSCGGRRSNREEHDPGQKEKGDQGVELTIPKTGNHVREPEPVRLGRDVRLDSIRQPDRSRACGLLEIKSRDVPARNEL